MFACFADLCNGKKIEYLASRGGNYQCTLTPVHKIAANWRHLEGKRSLNTKSNLKNLKI